MATGGWTILCDFDGTICPTDVIDALLHRYGRPGWEALEDDWRAGRIGSRECMRGQVALLEVDKPALDAFLDGLAIDPAFPGFVAAAQEAGHRLRVVSDGLDYAIRRILLREGLGWLPIHANAMLAEREAHRWSLSSPAAAAGCGSGTCKCGVASATAGSDPRLLIGDGASDFCLAGRVDLVFAKGRLQGHCATHALAYLPIHDFSDARALLPQLASTTRHVQQPHWKAS